MLWIHDVSLLYKETQIWPFYVHTPHEKVNAFSRFVIYYGVLLALLKKDTQPVMIALGVALLATLFYAQTVPQSHKDNHKDNHKDATVKTEVQNNLTAKCPTVTTNNYMGNPILGVHNNVDAGCEVSAERINEVFLHNLPHDHWDIYGKNNSQRQFYTVPVNDQSAFAKLLYDPDIVMKCDKSQKACYY